MITDNICMILDRRARYEYWATKRHFIQYQQAIATWAERSAEQRRPERTTAKCRSMGRTGGPFVPRARAASQGVPHVSAPLQRPHARARTSPPPRPPFFGRPPSQAIRHDWGPERAARRARRAGGQRWSLESSRRADEGCWGACARHAACAERHSGEHEGAARRSGGNAGSQSLDDELHWHPVAFGQVDRILWHADGHPVASLCLVLEIYIVENLVWVSEIC